MKIVFNLVSGVALVALAVGCSAPGLQSGVDAKIQAVRQQFAPDKHLAIFNVAAKKSGSSVVLQGEVNDPAAKEALVHSVGEVASVKDEIILLPEESLGEKTYGIAVVSAATIREEPAPAAELGTQVLLGHSFQIWKTQGHWSYVQSRDGYLGWMERDQFIPASLETVTTWSNANRVIVTSFFDRVWQGTNKSLPVCDVVPGCLLKKVGFDRGFVQVQLADGRQGFIAEASVMDYSEWKKSRQPTAENIEQTAKSLLGVPYLWGGTSTKMLDCSGFTKTVYFLNGIDLLRNASHQFRQGTPIEAGESLNNLRKGDLLFFGRKNQDGKPKVTHVGIYLEKGLFIHSSGLVHISSLDPKSELRDEARIRGFLGARRILPQ